MRVIDMYDDLGKEYLLGLDGAEPSEFFKTAEWRESAELLDRDFAVILVDEEGHEHRKFASFDAGNTWMSLYYLLNVEHGLPDYAVKVASVNLLKKAAAYDMNLGDAEAFLQELAAMDGTKTASFVIDERRVMVKDANSGKAMKQLAGAGGHLLGQLGHAASTAEHAVPNLLHAAPVAGVGRVIPSHVPRSLVPSAPIAGAGHVVPVSARKAPAIPEGVLVGNAAEAPMVAPARVRPTAAKAEATSARVPAQEAQGAQVSAQTSTPAAVPAQERRDWATPLAVGGLTAGALGTGMVAGSLAGNRKHGSALKQAWEKVAAGDNFGPGSPGSMSGSIGKSLGSTMPPSPAPAPTAMSASPLKLPSMGGGPVAPSPVKLASFDLIKEAQDAWASFDPYDRREAALALVKVASQDGAKVPWEIAKYAGEILNPDFKVVMRHRQDRTSDEALSADYDRLGKVASILTLDEAVEALYMLDEQAGLLTRYGDNLPDPVLAVCGHEKKADFSWINGGHYVNERQLIAFSASPELRRRMKELFTGDLADKFREDPIGTFKGLPEQQKLVILRLATQGSGSNDGGFSIGGQATR